MKRVLISDNREELVTTLESLLKNWGYRTISTAEPERFLEICKELEPDLMILGPALFATASTTKQIKTFDTPRIFILDPETQPDWQPLGEILAYPVDIFKLFALVQGHLEKIPRRNIRLNVRMPGLYYKNSEVCIAEILSLSPEGLFLKTGSKLEVSNNIKLVLPLIGMQTELEVLGRVVYQIEPTPDNNYMQGMGIEFTDMNQNMMHALEQYVEGLLLNQLNDRQYSSNVLCTDHLRKHSDPPVLQLTPVG